MGWRIRGTSMCPLAADGGEKCRTIYVCISFLRAVVVVLVVSVIIWIYFVVVLFSLRMYAQQMFSALFTGVLNTIACVCRRGVSGVFSSWSTVGVSFQCEGFVWAREVSPHF